MIYKKPPDLCYPISKQWIEMRPGYGKGIRFI